MKRKIMLMILTACLVFGSVPALAEDEGAAVLEDKNPALQLGTNMLNTISLCSEHDEVYVGEKIRVVASIKSKKPGTGVKAVWKVNGEEVPEFPGEMIILQRNTLLLFTYFVPPYENASEMAVSLSLYDQKGQLLSSAEKLLIVHKEIPVSIVSTAETQKEYNDKDFIASMQIENKTGRYFEYKAYWELNGEIIEGSEKPRFGVGLNTEAKCPIDLDEFAGKKIKATFVLDNGLNRISRGIEVEVMEYPPEVLHQRKVEEMRKVVKTAEIECTLLRDSNIYKEYTLKTKTGFSEKGTTGIYIDYSGTYSAKVRFPDGTVGWLPYRNISISKADYTDYNDCPDEMKELFVNETGYESDTEYLIWISLKFQRVNVFSGEKGNWKLVRSALCATGKNTTPTISGVFKFFSLEKRWDFGKYYVGPVMRFNGGAALHSRTYKPDGSLLDPTLGKPASQGCVRLKQEDIDWMVKNIPLKTTVVVY